MPMPADPSDTVSSVTSSFGKDVYEGLTRVPKTLPSKYFYDAKGDELFQQIMHMPAYYLMDAEHEIIDTHKASMHQLFGNDFNLVELGAGDGYKTKVLLKYLLEANADFHYKPIDISGNVLQILENNLKSNLPGLLFEPIQGDYFEALHDLQSHRERREIVMFLGSNIGNLKHDRARKFLQKVRKYMTPDDLMLIGMDLKKDPAVILNAYNDKAGITRDFNLNLLHRINRELDADFNVDQFMHWESYDPVEGAAKSFLVSKKKQTVSIKAIDFTVEMDAWEAIQVELSQKYSIRKVEEMAEEAGFEVVRHFFDARKYFVDSLWRAV